MRLRDDADQHASIVHNGKTTLLNKTPWSLPHHGGQPIFAQPITFNWNPVQGKCGMLQCKVVRTSRCGTRVCGRVFVRLNQLFPGEPACDNFPLCNKRKMVLRGKGELQIAFNVHSSGEGGDCSAFDGQPLTGGARSHSHGDSHGSRGKGKGKGGHSSSKGGHKSHKGNHRHHQHHHHSRHHDDQVAEHGGKVLV